NLTKKAQTELRTIDFTGSDSGEGNNFSSASHRADVSPQDRIWPSAMQTANPSPYAAPLRTQASVRQSLSCLHALVKASSRLPASSYFQPTMRASGNQPRILGRTFMAGASTRWSRPSRVANFGDEIASPAPLNAWSTR